MRRLSLPALLLLAIGCQPAGSFQGKLVDALSGQPMADVRLLAKANGEEADLTCQIFEATSGPDGIFNMQGLCAGISYALQPGLDFYLIQGVGDIPGGQPSAGVKDLEVWRAPAAGVYLLDGGKMDKQSTATDVESKNIYESEEKVWYPAKLPLTYTKVAGTQMLMISGQKNIEKLGFYPVVESGPRTFGTKAEPDKDEETWSYIGIRFTTDTEYERLQVKPDDSKIKKVSEGDRQVIYIPADAVAPGQYALWEEGGRRAYALEF
ncbi:MAG: hypothetical protein ABIO70_20250 [Pseudomonadota bacterium]